MAEFVLPLRWGKFSVEVRVHHVLILVALIAFSGMWFHFYPPFTDADGMEYASQAWLFAHGKTYQADTLQAFALPTLTNAQGVKTAHARFPIGYPLILTPFVFFGFKALFLSGWIIHLLIFVTIYFLFKKLNLNPLYAICYLFFPFLIFYSQQLMSDAAGFLFLLVGIYFLQSPKERPLLAAVAFGFGIWVRYLDGLFMLPWLYAYYSMHKQEKKQLVAMAGIIAAFVVVLMAFNFFQYGNPIGYAETGELARFGADGFFLRMIKFALLFVIGNNTITQYQYVVPPFIPIFLIFFVATFWKKSPFLRSAGLTAALAILFFSFYTYDLPTRFMLIPITLCSFSLVYLAEWISSQKKALHPLILVGIGTLLLAISSYGMLSYYHVSLTNNLYFSELAYAQTTPNSLIITNTMDHLFYPGFGERKMVFLDKNQYTTIFNEHPAWFWETCQCEQVFIVNLHDLAERQEVVAKEIVRVKR